MSTTVHVSNISSQTSEKEVRDFFSFCGKISSLSVTPTSDAPDAEKSATVTFEKETAAKTALLLDNTQLGPTHVKVSGAQSLDDIAGSKATTTADDNDEDIPQEDKPRSRIVAEYLAHGYRLGDHTLQKAIEVDKKHGISSRFTATLQNFDQKLQATDKAKSIDSKYGVTERANAGWRGLNSYFEKAMGTPTGQKLVSFYSQGEKQILDIHNEAARLAGLKNAGGSGSGAKDEKSDVTVSPVAGTDKTRCTCGGTEGVCQCEPGKCACEGCAK